MRIHTWIGALVLASGTAGAQQIPDSTARKQQRALDSLSAAVAALHARLDSVAAAAAATPAPAVRAAGAYMNASFVGLTTFGWASTADVPSIEVGDHDARVRGFTIPNAEFVLDGAVDPYFKGVANMVYKLDAKGESGLELEEMYFLTTSLPYNLQLKGGQAFIEFGRQNPQHPHAWAFADQPLVLNRMFGPEGLRSQGLRLSWLLPTSFYTEATLGVFNSAGTTTWSFRSDESGLIHGGAAVERAVGGARDLLYVPRLATSFDLTSTQTLLVGASGAFGPNNSGPATTTQIAGADLYWKWKSPRASQGFPFVAFQAEAIQRRYDAATRPAGVDAPVMLPSQVIKDRGAYAQLQWGIQPRVIAAVRAEDVGGDEVATPAFSVSDRINRSRYSTNVTWFPTEFSKFRVQYNYDRRAGVGNDHSLWMQFEFLLGAHAAHKF
ncbi:MAG: hypothetical protein ACYC5V_16000 [Gemmatimonadaceae bacterium]